MRKSKNVTRKRNFTGKSKGQRSVCVGTSYLTNDTKKQTTTSRETIPLKEKECICWHPSNIFRKELHNSIIF
jgi:hypothetical protein